MRRLTGPLTICLLLVSAAPLFGTTSAQTVVATIDLPGQPEQSSIDANPITNRIYVANTYVCIAEVCGNPGNTVSVIDGGTNTVIATIEVGSKPTGVAVNQNTNRIYVVNKDSGTVSVIDGVQNSVEATISVGLIPHDVAVNSDTNRIYVGSLGTGSVVVIDGGTNGILATVRVPNPNGIEVNPATNRIYVVSQFGGAPPPPGTLFVLDGETNAITATLSVGAYATQVGVNPTTSRVYVTNSYDGTVSVVDGNSNTLLATVPVGQSPVAVDVNPAVNRVYVAVTASMRLAIIEGETNTITGEIATPSGTIPNAVAVNLSTGRVYAVGITARAAVVAVIEDTAPPPPISCGDTITSDTFLTDDLLNCPADGLVIGADNITLDCQEHRIVGTFDPAVSLDQVSGISAQGRNNVVVKNCIVENFFYGILLGSTIQSRLVDNFARNNYQSGFSLVSSSHNTLDFNTATASTGMGFLLHQSTFNSLVNNRAENNINWGFFLTISSDDNLLSHNRASGSADGFLLFSSSRNIIDSSQSTNNAIGFRLLTNFGFPGSDFNTITSNIVQGNTFMGIELTDSSNNQVYNNIFENTSNAADNGSNFWNVAKTPATNVLGGPFLGGNFWSDYAGADTDGDGLGDTLLPYNSGGHIVNGGDFLPLVSPNVSENVDLIVTDVSVSPQDPIDGDNITISATVLNNGTLGVSMSFVVNFRINIYYFANVNVSPLPANSPSTVSVSTIMLGGTNSIAVTADYFNEIDESDEGNNVLTLPPMIVGLPDLAISSFDAFPSAPFEGNLVDFTVTATNLGSSTLREFAIVVVLDCPSASSPCPPENFIAFRIIRGIVAGSSEQLQGTWEATLGDHSLSALAIFDIAEEFELIFPENNFATITFPPIVPDEEPPETFVVSAEDGNFNAVEKGGATLSDTISFTLSGTDNAAVVGFECSLDNSPFLACTSPATYSGLSLGGHTFEVRAIDSSNNMDPSPAVFTWTVESAPDTSILAVLPPISDGGMTRSRFIRFIFAGTDNAGVQGFECSLDGAAFTACSSPVFYLVARGVHIFQVRAIDTAGFADQTPAVFTWTVL